MREYKNNSNIPWHGFLLALVLGLITTITLAQLIALFGSIDRLTIPDQSPEYGSNHIPGYLDDIAPPFRIAQWEVPADNPNGYLYNYLEIGTDIVEYTYGAPMATWDRAVHGDIPPAAFITRCFVGLPFRCMYYDNFSVASGGKKYTLTYFDLMKDRAGFRAGAQSPGPTSFWNDRRIPLAPMWGGILGNTLIFGLCFYLPIAIPRGIRQHRRKRRGLCLVCGYAVEDLGTCPECGAECPKPRVSQAAS